MTHTRWLPRHAFTNYLVKISESLLPCAISLALEMVSNAKINHALLLFMIISSFDDVKKIFITTSMFTQ